MYVDDLLVVGDDRNIQKLVDELSKKLRLKVTGKLEEDRIRFLGKVIEKEEDGTIALYMEKEYYEVMVNLYPGGKEVKRPPICFSFMIVIEKRIGNRCHPRQQQPFEPH